MTLMHLVGNVCLMLAMAALAIDNASKGRAGFMALDVLVFLFILIIVYPTLFGDAPLKK